MFRQHMTQCNCTFFPQQQIIQQPTFRSPPRNTKTSQSKKSLKFHSSSKNKDIHRVKLKKEIYHKIQNNRIQPENRVDVASIHAVINLKLEKYSKKEEIGISPEVAKSNANNADMRLKNSRSIYYQAKQNTSGLIKIVDRQNEQYSRAGSPLNIIDHNLRKTVTFNYKNQYEMRPNTAKILEVSPPPPMKINRKYLENSNSTTLAGSIVPNSVELLHKHPNENISWSQHSMNQPKHPNQYQLQKRFSEQIYNQQSNNFNPDYFSRHRISSNIYQLSRLSQIMNEKEETQSIYEGEVVQQPGEIQYSRVIISCKKLMDQKNGVLQQSAQTKLFNFQQHGSAPLIKSGVFEKICLSKF